MNGIDNPNKEKDKNINFVRMAIFLVWGEYFCISKESLPRGVVLETHSSQKVLSETEGKAVDLTLMAGQVW